MSQNILKRIFLFLLFGYLISFCFIVYSHPVKTLTEWDWTKGTNADFNIYQRAARNFINGNDIYRGTKYFYPPFFAILLSPLSILPTAFQKPIWVILNIITLIFLWFFLLHYFTKGGIKKYQAGTIALLVIASSIPLLHNFKWGQVSILISLLIISSYIAFKKNKHLLSALTLAIASSIKVMPAIFLLFYIVNWKKGVSKLLIWFMVFSFLFLWLFPLLFLGSEKTYHAYKTFDKKTTSTHAWLFHGLWNEQTIRGIVFRYFSKDYPSAKGKKPFPPFNQPPPSFLPLYPTFSAEGAQTVGIILSLILLIYTLSLSRRKKHYHDTLPENEQEDVLFCFFISGFLAFTPHAWIHYYVLSIVPYYLLLTSLIKKNVKEPGFPFILFMLSFLTFHGNIFIMKSSSLLA
ncbi:MAG: DUF2029 domain-containing protein, partial [Deltaproteobacteria bacterium]|nr:DUF2029 domain-containing protein [Deltaproteobacteria bacterium]